MRRILSACLLATPLLLPAAAFAIEPTTANAPLSSNARPVSTGVEEAKIVYSPGLHIASDYYSKLLPQNAEFVLKLKVDAQGNPQDVQVVKSQNAHLDERLLEYVRQCRFAPAKLDNQAVPLSMNLTVVVQQ